MAAAELEEAAAELPVVEGVTPAGRNGAQRAGDAGHTHALSDLERSRRAELVGPGQHVDEMRGQRQHDGSGEAVGGQLDRRGQDVGERQPPVACVQREPTVHGARHRHAADVAPQRHDRHPLGAHGGRVGPRSGAPDGQERLGGRSGRGHHGEDVAPEAAQVRAHHRHHRSRGDGGIGSRAAVGEHPDPGRRRQLVGRRDHAAQPGPGAEGSEREGHGSASMPPAARGPGGVRSGPCSAMAGFGDRTSG